MRVPSFTLCLAALPALAAAYSQHSNFTTQCKDVSYGNSAVLSASCLKNSNSDTGVVGSNTYTKSEFEIALCVGIDYITAKLSYQPLGKYPNYCSDCILEDSQFLKCTCQSDGLVVTSRLDLDEGVGNVNGSLACRWY
ncbi:Cyanovirin-N [Cladorrhinum sp. PSN259]|nr:Cyanovirin-N [Cladorrhinum sp. PSN259]